MRKARSNKGFVSITLAGRSELREPISGSWLTRNLQTTVSRRNS
jgi:hypothetical protein